MLYLSCAPGLLQRLTFYPHLKFILMSSSSSSSSSVAATDSTVSSSVRRYDINGVTVEFPFEAYPPQLAYMTKASFQTCALVLHSPYS